MKRFQITCRCEAHHFPHRLGIKAGKCKGETWARLQKEGGNKLCETCNAKNSDDECEVATGAENITCCEIFNEMMHQQTIDLTFDEDQYISWFEEDPYGEFEK